MADKDQKETSFEEQRRVNGSDQLLAEDKRKINGSDQYDSLVGTTANTGNSKAVNRFYVMAHCMSVALGMLSFGIAIGTMSPVGPILAYNLGWDDTSNKHNLAFINTSGNIGAFMGALISPFLVPYGKRRMIIVVNIGLILGLCLEFIPKLDNILIPLIIGKFIQGVAAGCFTVMCPAFINELSPVELAGSTGALNQIFCTFGIFLPAIMCVTVPYCVGEYSNKFEDQCDAATKDSFLVHSYWRVVNAIGIVFAAAQILLLAFVYNLDSAHEGKQKGDNQAILAILRKTYTTEQETQFRMGQLLTENDEADQKENVGFYQALTDPKYRKASWVGAALMMFQQLTGINAIMFYAAQIFTGIGHISTFQATAIAQFVNFLSPMPNIVILQYIGKRPMMLICQTLCCLTMLGSGYFTYIEGDTGNLIFILLFIISFEFGPGSCDWPYLGEICHPTGIAIASQVNWIFTILVGFVYPLLQGPPALHEGVIDFVFAGISFIGIFFVYFYFIETKGKTKEQIARAFYAEEITSKHYQQIDADAQAD